MSALSELRAAKRGPKSKPIVERFWPKVDKNGPIPEYRPDLGPCWIWTAALNPYGYGRFFIETYPDRTCRYRGAHIVSYLLLIGPIPDDRELDHLCRVRNCVNPHHLEPVTHAENCRRGVGIAHAAACKRAKTHCLEGHSYAGQNLYINPKGVRICRTCKRDTMRLIRAKRRSAWFSQN